MRVLLLTIGLLLLLMSSSVYGQDQEAVTEPPPEEEQKVDILPEEAVLLGEAEENGIIALAWLYRPSAAAVEAEQGARLPHLLFLRFISVSNSQVCRSNSQWKRKKAQQNSPRQFSCHYTEYRNDINNQQQKSIYKSGCPFPEYYHNMPAPARTIGIGIGKFVQEQQEGSQNPRRNRCPYTTGGYSTGLYKI